jgi:hypothetical protein
VSKSLGSETRSRLRACVVCLEGTEHRLKVRCGALKIKLTTELEAPADAVWGALRKTESFRYVARPLLCLEADLPRRWPDRGGVIRVERLLLFCVVPAWSHELRFVRLDDEEREMLTHERGGPIREWNHRIRVEPVSERLCRYTDEVEVHAGALTPLVWLLAQLFYRYRQMRWRGLARVLG